MSFPLQESQEQQLAQPQPKAPGQQRRKKGSRESPSTSSIDVVGTSGDDSIIIGGGGGDGDRSSSSSGGVSGDGCSSSGGGDRSSSIADTWEASGVTPAQWTAWAQLLSGRLRGLHLHLPTERQLDDRALQECADALARLGVTRRPRWLADALKGKVAASR